MRFNPTNAFVKGTITSNLFVSSYVGTISTLQLAHYPNGTYSLNSISVNNVTTDNPSWLHKDPNNGILYCLNEGLSVDNGSISSFKVGEGGVLSLVDNVSTISGPVSSILFNGGKNLAAAHYTGSSLTTHTVEANGTLTPLQTLTFTLSTPGPYDLGKQLAPHPHEALIDPTEKFILVPDLGADLVRIFSIDAETALLTEQTPYKAPPGSGPRHGAFHVTESGRTFFYLVSELGNTVSSFEITYKNGTEPGMSFGLVDRHDIFGNETEVPKRSAAAECLITPDGKYILTSDRNATILAIPDPPAHPLNKNTHPTDTLQTWTINNDETESNFGSLSLAQIFPAGGHFPRQMSMNKEGTLVAVGLQRSARVVIVERNMTTGEFGQFVADIQIGEFTDADDTDGQITSVIWDENEDVYM
ncbi:hypothetical protein NHQ30_002247 [Ciborinia camelliae]|nr:hypothetical protein NHQ30_002247 [Ciborinia camelliae]